MSITTLNRHFLGVERSATGRAWRDRLDERGNARALAIVQRHGVPELLARIVAGREVEADGVDRYLDPTLRNLMPDPNVLTDMAAAAVRIADAAERGEPVAIFGDYDVDGATSTALLASFLRRAGLDPLLHIPDRIFEGYGPNVEAIRSLAERGAKLLITVDCGTTSLEPLAEAARLGLDTVVIDHHQADEELPKAVIVNPNRLDDLSQLGHLAAVGLVFLTIVAVNRELRRRGFWTAARPEPDLLDFVDLVALGTIADVVPLIGLNRAFVTKGLIAMRRRERVGLTALIDVARLTGPPEPWHLGFMLGPRINAGGRIGRADLGARLLLCEDPSEAAALAAELDHLNRERQTIELAAVAEAETEAMAALGLEERGATVVTASPRWHPGVVGLVAARLKERFGRPAFAVALGPGETGAGSGRSIPGVDLGRAVRHAVAEGLLVKGGGHAMAAGITLRKDALSAFRAYLEETLAGAVEAARRDEFAPGRRRPDRPRRECRTACHHRPRRSVWRRQSRAGDRAARAIPCLCRGGRPGPCAGAPALRRRQHDQRHRVPRRRAEARAGPVRQPRAAGPCGGLALPRPLAGRRAHAASPDRRRLRRPGRSAH